MTERRTGVSLQQLRIGLAISAIIGVIAIAVIVLLVRNRGVPLNSERFEAAQNLWRESGPTDYDIEVQTSGPRVARYRVQVRESEAVAAFIDDRPITSPHAIATWSVPGMFGTIASDVESQAAIAEGTADDDTPHVAIWGVFDSTLGYPTHYRRVQWSDDLEAGFDVVSFREIKNPD